MKGHHLLLWPALVAGLLVSTPSTAQPKGFLLPTTPKPVPPPPPPSAAIPTPTSPVTLATWAAQTPAVRDSMIVAGIEGALLASSGPDGDRIGIQDGCFNAETPTGAEERLLPIAAKTPNAGFLDSLLSSTGCRGR